MTLAKREESVAEQSTSALKHRKKLVALAIGAMTTTGVAQAQLEEIVVTATKRAESAQDIPVAIQAINGDTLEKLGVATFDEYIKFLPNVTQQGRGPGRSEIYIRGVATEQSNNTVSSVQGSAPQVALYLDEQPVAFGGRNLDVYAADLNRVEVLPGPQGTLFGASSQSGTIRYITNAPSTEGFEAGVKVGFSSTEGGETSNSAEGFINIPLSDTVAFRGVFYNDNQGGWIDNVATSFNPNGAELINVINRNQISGAAFIQEGATLPGTSNADQVQNDQNDAQYTGVRLGLSWDINENWNVLLKHTEQDLNTEGAFEIAPQTGEFDQSQIFTPDFNDDSFGLTTWTVTGRLGALDVVYTGGFLDRDVDSLFDYTLYSFGGGYQAYYITNTPYSATGATEVFDFRKQFVGNTKSEKVTHEIRFQGEVGDRFKYTFGGFFDQTETRSIDEFQYFGAEAAGFDTAVISGNGLIPGVNSQQGGGIAAIFRNDFTRDEDQTAFFADVSIALSDTVTFSAGARNYDIDFELFGSTGSSFGCKGVDPLGLPTVRPVGTDIAIGVPRADGSIGCDANSFDNDVTDRLAALGAGDLASLLGSDTFGGGGINGGEAIFAAIQDGTLNVEGLDGTGSANQDDTIFRFTFDWKVSDDILLFTTLSEGFRPQVTNRNAGQASSNQTGPFEGFRVAPVAETDELTNFEIGFKGDFLENRLRLNATYYNSEIDNLQTSRFDPSNVAFLVFIENVGDAEVQGIDLDFAYAVSDQWTLSGAAAWVDSEITSLNPQLVGLAAPVGSELPFTPDFGFNFRARYDFDWSSFGADGYVQGSVTYTGDSFSGIIGNANFIEDQVQRIFGASSGLQIVNEGGTFGSSSVASELPNGFGTTVVNGETFFSNGRFVQESYTTFNLSAGLDKDNWGLELFVNNLFDEEGVTNISTFDFTPKVSVIRPRTIGLRFRADFQ